MIQLYILNDDDEMTASNYKSVLGTLLGCSLTLQGRPPWFTGQAGLKGRLPSVFTTMASAPHLENAM